MEGKPRTYDPATVVLCIGGKKIAAPTADEFRIPVRLGPRTYIVNFGAQVEVRYPFLVETEEQAKMLDDIFNAVGQAIGRLNAATYGEPVATRGECASKE